jgi:hypothetical protein
MKEEQKVVSSLIVLPARKPAPRIPRESNSRKAATGVKATVTG